MPFKRVGKKLRLDGPTLVIGDFNAKEGKETTGNSIGAHGMGQRNGRGEGLIEFAGRNKMVSFNSNLGDFLEGSV